MLCRSTYRVLQKGHTFFNIQQFIISYNISIISNNNNNNKDVISDQQFKKNNSVFITMWRFLFSTRKNIVKKIQACEARPMEA